MHVPTLILGSSPTSRRATRSPHRLSRVSNAIAAVASDPSPQLRAPMSAVIRGANSPEASGLSTEHPARNTVWS
jgi:hypothetical protein